MFRRTKNSNRANGEEFFKKMNINVNNNIRFEKPLKINETSFCA